MKFNQYAWSLYKQSKQWQEFSKEFDQSNLQVNEYSILLKYNPIEVEGVTSEQEFNEVMEELWVNCISECSTDECDTPSTLEEAGQLYEAIISHGVGDVHYVLVAEGDYRSMLVGVVMLSFLCYYVAEEYFFPYLFRYRAFALYKIADTFDIDLPTLPKKPDYKARCLYYWELCKVFYQFRQDNDLSPLELCAFLYDYAPSYISTLSEIDTDLPAPTQAWCIGGLITEGDIQSNPTLWQANPETLRGDILIHYQTSPISAITHIWLSETDGVIDPFFHYYANVYFNNRNGMEIPPITLKEMREDPYFSTHSLVRKSFQGVNGWRFTNEDYTNLLRMIKAKGYDTTQLPQLYAPQLKTDVSVKRERDVETELLEYYLTKMGLTQGKDYHRQIPIQSGRGTSIFPDYAIGYDGQRCKALIEAKYHMKSSKEVSDAFGQARSYALILQADILVLCDKDCLILYKNNNGFDRSQSERYYWGELSNPDTFNKIKSYLTR